MSRLALTVAVVLVGATISANAADEIPLRATALDEFAPVASSPYFAWAQTRPGDGRHVNAYVKPGRGRPCV
jgi:hypothetical protein